MSLRATLRVLKNFIIATCAGVSVFSTTFIVSLLLGTASNHPILGPLEGLLSFLLTICALSLLIALTRELIVHVDRLDKPFVPETTRFINRRQLIESSLQDRLRSQSQPLRRQVPVR